MPAGDHAFLFDIPLPSKVFDTATGANHQYHTYRVEAIIERRLKSDFVVSQPVRIYQVSDLETSYLRPHCPLVSTFHGRNLTTCKWLNISRLSRVTPTKISNTASPSLTGTFPLVAHFLWNAGLHRYWNTPSSTLLQPKLLRNRLRGWRLLLQNQRNTTCGLLLQHKVKLFSPRPSISLEMSPRWTTTLRRLNGGSPHRFLCLRVSTLARRVSRPNTSRSLMNFLSLLSSTTRQVM